MTTATSPAIAPPALEEALPIVLDLVEAASRAILEIYTANTETVRLKDDRSPVTTADLVSHRILVEGLRRLTPRAPVLSEESASIGWAERRQWTGYWLVDPLDGTKEFLHRNDQFTVNVAWIQDGKPWLGVVGVPVTGETFIGTVDGAYRIDHASGRRDPLHSGTYRPGQPLRVAVSRSHPSIEVQEFLNRYDRVERIPLGSSLKLCLVAAGEVDLYPRLGPIMEWDIAAAHAVVEAAGGFLRTVDGQAIRYNRESLYAPWFLAGRPGVEV